jgi:tetratricopeptide (TPR) repeat protein
MKLKAALTLFALVFASAISISCYWDQETVAMEREKFPDALELISGKFLRHSPEYYYWVIKDGERALSAHPDSLALYDNVAVAYSKLGEDEAAIALMLRKDSLSPNIYETEANLGTFYIHAGQYEAGLEHIKNAIEINPEAHFGREVYQQYLVEYVMEKVDGGKIKLPMGLMTGNSGPPSIEKERNFNTFILTKYNRKNGTSEPHIPLEERQRAVKGILGMMRFGNHDSPILLEALGDLMSSYRRDIDSKFLAVMAYLKAAHAVEDEKAKRAYQARAARLLSFLQVKSSARYRGLELEEAERQLAIIIAEAEKLEASITGQEKTWILEGKNPVIAFQNVFFEEPNVMRLQVFGEHSTPKMNELRALVKSSGNLQGVDSIGQLHVPVDSAMRSHIDLIFYIEAEPEPQEETPAVEQGTEIQGIKSDPGSDESPIGLYLLLGCVPVLGGLLYILRRKRTHK